MAQPYSDDALLSSTTSINNKTYFMMLKNALDTIIQENVGQTQIQVVLNVYDFTKSVKYFKYIGLGIFHTGVVLYNNEFAYGKHQEDDTGVYTTLPGQSLSFAVYYKTITFPPIQITPHQVVDIILQLSQQFKGNNYNLIQKNCNNFSSTLLNRLYGQDKLPFFIIRSSRIAQSFNNFLECFGWELLSSDDEKQNHLKLQQNQEAHLS